MQAEEHAMPELHCVAPTWACLEVEVPLPFLWGIAVFIWARNPPPVADQVAARLHSTSFGRPVWGGLRSGKRYFRVEGLAFWDQGLRFRVLRLGI